MGTPKKPLTTCWVSSFSIVARGREKWEWLLIIIRTFRPFAAKNVTIASQSLAASGNSKIAIIKQFLPRQFDLGGWNCI